MLHAHSSFDGYICASFAVRRDDEEDQVMSSCYDRAFLRVAAAASAFLN
jgi:hypothetical protein